MNSQYDAALGLLGVTSDSDLRTVTSTYRRLARATHPDVSSAPDAGDRFASVTAAYRLVTEARGAKASRPPTPSSQPGHPPQVDVRLGHASPFPSPLIGRVTRRAPITVGPVFISSSRTGSPGGDSDD